MFLFSSVINVPPPLIIITNITFNIVLTVYQVLILSTLFISIHLILIIALK